jgi:hypothetical protein
MLRPLNKLQPLRKNKQACFDLAVSQVFWWYHRRPLPSWLFLWNVFIIFYRNLKVSLKSFSIIFFERLFSNLGGERYRAQRFLVSSRLSKIVLRKSRYDHRRCHFPRSWGGEKRASGIKSLKTIAIREVIAL